jgi:ribonuclease HI
LQELQARQLYIHIHGSKALEDIYHWIVTPPLDSRLASVCCNNDIGTSTKDEASAEDVSIPLRTGQVWEITYNNNTRIKEIISYTEQTIEFMEWLVTNTVTPGTTLTLSMLSNPISPYPVGAHGTHRELYSNFFPIGCSSRLLLLSPERHDNAQLKTTAKVKSFKLKMPLPPQPFTPNTSLWHLLHEQGRHAKSIFTDGSYDLSSTPTRGGAAVVFQTNENTFHCITIIKDIQIESVFDLELAALALARVASASADPHCCIYSDSQASIQVMENINNREYQKQPLQHALNQHHLYSSVPCKWVNSHVEKRNPIRTTWTKAEIGNFIADKMAEHQQEHILFGPPVIITITQCRSNSQQS